ncbi:hypothetical protein ACOSQ2_006956 [Xanthoceras sorbifolium]
MGTFRMFSDHSCTRIVFEIDNKPYIPLPPVGSTCNPNAELGQLVYGDDLGDNILNYLGDNEDGVRVGDETSEDEESVGDKVERNHNEFIVGDGVERNEKGDDNEIVGDINELETMTIYNYLRDINPRKMMSLLVTQTLNCQKLK